HFKKYTRSKTINNKRLLILNNYRSYTIPEFRAFYKEKDIDLIKNYIFYITKVNFLASFYSAFNTSITQSNI
ncbi:hypothetical protein M433DRAFT_533373, partial [Acidomyces richmondensis BFW]